MSVLKALAREWLPHVIVRLIRQVQGGRIYFEGEMNIGVMDHD